MQAGTAFLKANFQSVIAKLDARWKRRRIACVIDAVGHVRENCPARGDFFRESECLFKTKMRRVRIVVKRVDDENVGVLCERDCLGRNVVAIGEIREARAC